LLILLLQNINVMTNTKVQNGAPAGAIYAMGVVGAAVYYISTATSFWMGVFGLLKSLVWPAFLVYEAMKSLAM
jgi:hypothetical protein